VVGVEAGANAVCYKPFDVEKLLSTVQELSVRGPLENSPNAGPQGVGIHGLEDIIRCADLVEHERSVHCLRDEIQQLGIQRSAGEPKPVNIGSLSQVPQVITQIPIIIDDGHQLLITKIWRRS